MPRLLHQSGVIPYRGSGEATEVLLITSSTTGQWQVPKGMLEPGLSPAESAEQEAFEEAGVLGMVIGGPVADYFYRKRGIIPARVTLYPMQVMRELSDEEWEEAGFRQRQWVDLEEAAARLSDGPLSGVMPLFVDWLSRRE